MTAPLKHTLTSSCCHCRLAGVSKKRLLTIISQFMEKAVPALDADEVFNALMARERLGSTGLGNGIAIPHCRLKTCSGIVGALITLDEPIDFDAADGKPVDLLFVLIVPGEHADEHVKTLATLAEKFSDFDFCHALRQARNDDELYNMAMAEIKDVI
ncbi:MAG: PTS IIA-like nitrogen regulatory protein PtsN [Pseudohongiellaceae bacterium]